MIKMKNMYRKFRRGKVWWIQHNETGKQESLRTKDKAEALRLLDLKNRPHAVAGFHLSMARTHLQLGNAEIISRTWKNVFETIIRTKTGNTKIRWERASRSKAFDTIRNLPLVETKTEQFLTILDSHMVSANVFLRRIHNFALDMNWLLTPVIPKRAWPKVQYGEKRAITFEEHKRILEREKNPERKAFYEVCWHVGGSQSDVARLHAENIDWQNRTITFNRIKTHQRTQVTFGLELENILRSRPSSGPLFPYLARVRAADRATEFRQRCKGLGIEGVSLHSYRYSWAERAKACAYPERFAQQALGHGSKAVARAYAKNADMKLPSLEAYENEMKQKIVQLEQKAA
jgi:integrase